MAEPAQLGGSRQSGGRWCSSPLAVVAARARMGGLAHLERRTAGVVISSVGVRHHVVLEGTLECDGTGTGTGPVDKKEAESKEAEKEK